VEHRVQRRSALDRHVVRQADREGLAVRPHRVVGMIARSPRVEAVRGIQPISAVDDGVLPVVAARDRRGVLKGADVRNRRRHRLERIGGVEHRRIRLLRISVVDGPPRTLRWLRWLRAAIAQRSVKLGVVGERESIVAQLGLHEKMDHSLGGRLGMGLLSGRRACNARKGRAQRVAPQGAGRGFLQGFSPVVMNEDDGGPSPGSHARNAIAESAPPPC
jgi:hypothetical protein